MLSLRATSYHSSKYHSSIQRFNGRLSLCLDRHICHCSAFWPAVQLIVIYIGRICFAKRGKQAAQLRGYGFRAQVGNSYKYAWVLCNRQEQGSGNMFYPHVRQVSIEQLHGPVATYWPGFVGAAMKRNFYIKIFEPVQEINKMSFFSAGKISGFCAEQIFLAVFRKRNKIL
jgi:hypothetical protein